MISSLEVVHDLVLWLITRRGTGDIIDIQVVILHVFFNVSRSDGCFKYLVARYKSLNVNGIFLTIVEHDFILTSHRICVDGLRETSH